MRTAVILNVDDTEANRYLRTRALDAAGFEVREAATGSDALEIIRKDPPDLILLDVNLRDMSGYEVCRRIKAMRDTASIPVLYISNTSRDQAAQIAGLEAGAEAYLMEPIEPAVLVATAKSLLRVRRMHEEMEAEVDRRSQAEEALRSRNRRLQLLSEVVGDLLSYDAPTDELINGIYKKFADELGLEVYFHYQVSGDGQRLHLGAWGGVSGELAKQVEWLDLGQMVCGKVALQKAPIIAENIQQSEEPSLEQVRSLGITACVCHPLLVDGRVFGTLSFCTRKRARFEHDELDLVQTLCHHVAIALDRHRLRTKLEFQASLLAQVHNAVIATDVEGHIVHWNKAAETMYQRKTEDVLGKNVMEITVPSAGREQAAKILQAVAETGSWEGEFRVQRKDGTTFPAFVTNAAIRSSAGSIIGYVGVSIDISEQKRAQEALQESERKLRRLVDSNIIGVLTANTERIVDANDIFLEMVGYTRQELLAGRLLWHEMTPPEYAGLDRRALEELDVRGTCQTFEKEYYRKDGTRIPILIGAARLNNKPEYLCYVLDLSERRKAEEALREGQKFESIGFLAGGVAHNLNNLLVGVMGNVSLVLEISSLPSGERVLLEEAIKSSERAAQLTSQLLAYAGKGRFTREPVDLSAFISGLSGLLRSSISRKIELQFHLAPGLPLIDADKGQIRQIVTNLVINGAEAIGEGDGVINVTARLQQFDEPGNHIFTTGRITSGTYLMLEVSDTGCGMDEITRARIFDPFFTTKFTGRGLGLSAVAGIVHSHKGAIAVSTAPGKGASFQVFLPFAGAAEVRLPDVGARSSAPGRLILVVDDEQAVLRLAKTALERSGFTVLLAQNGGEAIDIFERRAHEISLVLLDMAMPVTDGMDILERLHLIQPDVPVMISSGYTEAETLRQFAGKRVAAFLQKPYTVQTLLDKVTGVLQLRAGHAGTG